MAVTAEDVQRAFQNVLGRAPSQDDINSYVAVSQSGALTDAQIYQTIANSQEANLIADPVIRFYQAVFGRVPDQAGFDNAEDYVRANGPSAQTYQMLSDMFAQSPEFTARYGTGTAVTAGFVQALYTSLLGRTASSAEIEAFTSGSNGYTTRGGVLYAISQSQEAIGLTDAAVSGFLQNAAEGDAVYTGSIFTAANGAPNAPGAGGQTFVLTESLDNLTGTAGNDTFIGNEETINNGDFVNGAAGTDTLQLFIGDSDESNVGADLTLRTTSVENIAIENSRDGAVGALDVDLGSANGVTSVASVGSDNDLTYSEVQNNVLISVQDTDADLTVTFDEDALSGTGTGTGTGGTEDGETVNIAVSNAGSITAANVATFSTVTVNVDGDDNLTTLSVAAGGQDTSYLQLNTDSDVDTLEITGGGRVVIGNAGAAAAVLNDVETVDASANTGGVAINLNQNEENVTFTGGAGNDFVSFGDDGSFGDDEDDQDVVDGGAGEDILSLTTDQADDLDGGNITNFEHLALRGAATGDVSIDITDGGFDDVVLIGGADVNVTFENFDGSTLFLANNVAQTVSFDSADTVSIAVDRPEALEELPATFAAIGAMPENIDADLTVDFSGGALTGAGAGTGGNTSVDTVNFDSGESEDTLTLDITLGEDTDTLNFTGNGDVLITALADTANAGANADLDDNASLFDLTGLTGAFSNEGAGQEGSQLFRIGNLGDPDDSSNIVTTFNFDEDATTPAQTASVIDLGSTTPAGGAATVDGDTDVIEFTTEFNSDIAVLNFNTAAGTANDLIDLSAFDIDRATFFTENVETINQVNGAGGDTLITFDGFEGRILLVGVQGVDQSDFIFGSN